MSGTSSASWSFSSQAVSHSPGPVRVADIPTAWWSQGGCISYTAASFQEAGGGKSQTIQGLPQELAFGSFPPCPIDPSLFYAAVTRPPNLSCLILLKFISDSCEKVYCGYSHLPWELFSAGWFIFPGCFGLKAPLYQHVLPRSLQDKKRVCVLPCKGEMCPFHSHFMGQSKLSGQTLFQMGNEAQSSLPERQENLAYWGAAVMSLRSSRG